MQKIKEIILDIHQMILNDRAIKKVSSESMEVNALNGLDSYGLVLFIVELENRLNLELDEILMQIRQAKTVGDIVEVVSCKVNNE